MSENYSVVIDNGSGCCKAGLSGEDAPRTKFATVVGKPKMPSIMVGMDQKEAYVGDEAEAKRGVLILKNPITHGIVTNWQDMTKIWHHTYYNQLRVTPEEHPCLLTQTPKNPRNNRQKMAQVMFQTFNVPSLYTAYQAVLALYSSGRTTGVVLDSGEGVTNTVPIYEGYALPHAIERSHYAGREVTEHLHKLLGEAGLRFSLSGELNILQDIKEKHSYVALDFEQEVKDYSQTNRNDCAYQLPDGQSITLGNQRFTCCQPLFTPSRYSLEMPAVQEMVFQSIMKCDLDVRKDLYANIVLSGGSTMFPGTTERTQRQLQKLVPSSVNLNVVGPPQRQFLPWIGGSILSSLSTFQAMWITKSQYQEQGAAIIHKKCF